jgi:hypothetical protein
LACLPLFALTILIMPCIAQHLRFYWHWYSLPNLLVRSTSVFFYRTHINITSAWPLCYALHHVPYVLSLLCSIEAGLPFIHFVGKVSRMSLKEKK